MAELREPGIYDIPNEEYHASAGLSSTGAKRILDSPARFKYERDHPQHKDVYDFGSAAHKVVLADESSVIVEVDYDSWRTDAAQGAKVAARAEGKIPLLTKQLIVVREMVEQLLEHPIAPKLLRAGGRIEPSLFWCDERTGIERRARLDVLPEARNGRVILPDYKTTAASANPTAFGKTAWNLGYVQQAPWYCDAVRAHGLADDVAFVFVVQEKNPPYLVSVNQLDVDAMRVGDERNQLAIDLYQQCTETDTWPGYPNEVALASIPRWAEYQHEDDMAALGATA